MKNKKRESLTEAMGCDSKTLQKIYEETVKGIVFAERNDVPTERSEKTSDHLIIAVTKMKKFHNSRKAITQKEKDLITLGYMIGMSIQKAHEDPLAELVRMIAELAKEK